MNGIDVIMELCHFSFTHFIGHENALFENIRYFIYSMIYWASSKISFILSFRTTAIFSPVTCTASNGWPLSAPKPDRQSQGFEEIPVVLRSDIPDWWSSNSLKILIPPKNLKNKSYPWLVKFE